MTHRVRWSEHQPIPGRSQELLCILAPDDRVAGTLTDMVVHGAGATRPGR